MKRRVPLKSPAKHEEKDRCQARSPRVYLCTRQEDMQVWKDGELGCQTVRESFSYFAKKLWMKVICQTVGDDLIVPAMPWWRVGLRVILVPICMGKIHFRSSNFCVSHSWTLKSGKIHTSTFETMYIMSRHGYDLWVVLKTVLSFSFISAKYLKDYRKSLKIHKIEKIQFC
jgi:hypothetical protein